MKYWVKRNILILKEWFKLFPLVKNSYDFDYSYALDFLDFKLKRMIDFLESDRALSITSKQSAQEIRIFLKFKEKVYNEEYALEYNDILKEKYGITQIFDIKNHSLKIKFQLNNKDITDVNELKRVEDLYQKEFRKAQEKQKRAHKLLWQYFEYKIQTWCD